MFEGGNAQGKTNLLEAIYFLSTARTPGAAAERQLISWSAWREEAGFSRTLARVREERSESRLEILLLLKGISPPQVKRIIRVNGVQRKVSELLGRLRAVMFSPRDIEIIGGEPQLRRRWLDLINLQLSARYFQALQRYGRVLAQRNSLLRAIASRQASSGELEFWNQALLESGSYIIFQRQKVLGRLREIVQRVHQQLSEGKENLSLNYCQNVSPEKKLEDFREIEQAFKLSLEKNREKEIMQGVSLTGPHRDDLRLLIKGVDMGTYGSRGQQRTIALSLKLAEAQLMLAESGESPVLLLDDVLSELDEERRGCLLETVSGYPQVLITTTELDRFPPEFLSLAKKFKIEAGRVESLAE